MTSDMTSGMTRSPTTSGDLRDVVTAALARVAPDADLAHLDAAEDLRDALELDSMDFLNIVTAVGERLGLEIPERDYPKLVTLDGFVAYLGARGDPPPPA